MGENTNPPAFPMPGATGQTRGMTLRDWFAGQALAGSLACGTDKTYSGMRADDARAALAAGAYLVADAMLKERAK